MRELKPNIKLTLHTISNFHSMQMQRHSHDTNILALIFSHRHQHCHSSSSQELHGEWKHYTLNQLTPSSTSFVMRCILRRPNHLQTVCMQIKWRRKCDINDNRHWNETTTMMVEWETEMRCKCCDTRRDVTWKLLGKVALSIYTTLARRAIKYLQLVFIVES